jgi:hypothetical protein
MYFGRNLYGYQSHMIVTSIKANTGLIDFPLSKKGALTKKIAYDQSIKIQKLFPA